jgi:hypothetical protein
MEILTRDICIVLDYLITESTHTQDGEIIENHYNIRTNAGEIVSKNYENIREPLKLLHDLSNYLNESNNAK